MNIIQKITILVVAYLLIATPAWACPVCEKQQPELLRGITHGAGPESNWDYVIIWSMTLIVVVTLFFSLKWLLKPGEKSLDHIKRTVLIGYDDTEK